LSAQPIAAATVVELDLAGRSALVTGGASGIGLACARRLAAAGAAVTVADLDGKRAAAVAEEIGGTPWEIDLADAAAITAAGLQVDILVNNAGFQHVARLEDFEPAVFESMLAVMVLAPFLLIRGALPHMYSQGFGRIVNVSSVHGLRASEFKAGYVAAKHGLEGLSKVVALEGAAHGVTCNTVCPGYVRTPLVEGQLADQAKAHGLAEAEVLERVILARSAIKRLIEPEEVAEMVAYLCSPAGSFVTGSSLVLDGGWCAQ
jgi:3-hydroxybutyrate dehydrogenase